MYVLLLLAPIAMYNKRIRMNEQLVATNDARGFALSIGREIIESQMALSLSLSQQNAVEFCTASDGWMQLFRIIK